MWPPDLFSQSDGVQQTNYLAQHYCQEAIRQISMLRPSAERDALIRLTEMVLTRDKWSCSCPRLTSGSYYWARSLAWAPPPSNSYSCCANQGLDTEASEITGVLFEVDLRCVLVLIMAAAEPHWVQTQSGWSGMRRSSRINSFHTFPLPRPKMIQVMSV